MKKFREYKGNTKKFRQNAGKQCVAMSLTAIIYNEITNINAWDSSSLNVILCIGNSLYTCISNSINKTFLLLTDVQGHAGKKNQAIFSSLCTPRIRPVIHYNQGRSGHHGATALPWYYFTAVNFFQYFNNIRKAELTCIVIYNIN